jgi:hypothetical protein
LFSPPSRAAFHHYFAWAAVSGAANDASFLAERDDPAASAIRPGKLIRMRCISQASTHSLKLSVDGCSNEIALNSHEDRPQVKARECLLIDRRDVGVRNRSSAGDDATDEPAHGARLLYFPYRSGIQERSGVLNVALEPSCKWLLREMVERACQLGVIKLLD